MIVLSMRLAAQGGAYARHHSVYGIIDLSAPHPEEA